MFTYSKEVASKILDGFNHKGWDLGKKFPIKE